MATLESLRQPRVYVFLFHIFLVYAIVAGLFGLLSGILFVTAALFGAYYQRFDQLPQERLFRFHSLINGYPEPEVKRRIIMHRGGCVDTPENTLEAIREAAEQGVAGVEFDLQFTVDDVGILLHDDTLERTTNGTGDVRLMTFEQIRHLDAAAKHSSRSKYNHRVKIPTLEECLLECLRHGLLIFIDCKAYADKTATLVDRMMNKYPELYESAAVCSFYPHIVYAMRRKNPNVITGLTYRKWYFSTEGDCLTPRCRGPKYFLLLLLDLVYSLTTYGITWLVCGNSFLLLNKESMSKDEVNWWKNFGISLIPWTVNSQAEKCFCLDYLKVPIITDGLNIKE